MENTMKFEEYINSIPTRSNVKKNRDHKKYPPLLHKIGGRTYFMNQIVHNGVNVFEKR